MKKKMTDLSRPKMVNPVGYLRINRVKRTKKANKRRSSRTIKKKGSEIFTSGVFRHLIVFEEVAWREEIR
jgi:hypothetical protein